VTSAGALDHMTSQVRGFVLNMIRTHAKTLQVAIVRDVEPPGGGGLSAELLTGAVQLDQEDLLLAEHVREYDEAVGIKIGNSLLVQEVEKDFVVLGVLSDSDAPITEDHGRSVFSGNGSQTAFTINHDLGVTPTAVHVTPGSIAARQLLHVSATATAITVTFGTAPVSGTNNVALYWTVKR
jgi:hypothetical protein